jgi:hypothetical protein
MASILVNNSNESNEIAEFFEGAIVSDLIQNTTESEKLVIFEPPAEVLFFPPSAGCVGSGSCACCGGSELNILL